MHERTAVTSSPDANVTGSPEDCLAGGGELGALMRSMDWSRTALGPVASWPQSLRTSVSIMLASGFAVVVAWGPEHIFLYNDRYRPILGATKHPMALGSRGADIFPEIWDFVGPLFRKTLAGETVAFDDVLLPLDRNGYLEECYFTLSYSPIRDESGGIGGLLAIVADTTERVRGERRLRTLRDLASVAPRAHTADEACKNAARTLSENPTDVPFALVYLLEANGKTARLVGRTGLDGEIGAAAEQWPLDEAARSGQVVVDDLHERFGALPGGTYPEPTRTALVLSLTRPGLAHPHGFIVAGVSPRRALDESTRTFFELAAEHVATAITNALSHETERRRAEALAEIDRAKTTFFSNVSHEFRTPLTLMLAPIEEMRIEHGGDSAVERDRIDLLHRNALRLLKLVNTLLEFSRIEAGRVQASYEPTDLAALTTDLASSFRSAVERAGLGLVIDCPSLPEPVHVDHDMWEKIVLNLLSNAFKFTFDGSITVRLRPIAGCVELAVTDTGVGIEERELPRLFERFHRVEGGRSRSHEGSGIGLALVQELVRMHGGEIRVFSAVGRGTTFCVRVPRGTAHLPNERILAERSLASTASGAAPYVQEAMRWLAPSDLPPTLPVHAKHELRERILVADDNSDMRDYMRRLLRETWNVEAVSDGQMAIDAIRRDPPDLVLADVMMPGLDGFALVRAIRADPAIRDTPVVLLSARAGEEATADGLRAGADDYLVKPFTARELLLRVTTRLAAAKQRANLYRAFMQAPFPVAILRGPTHVVEAANEAILRAWGKGAGIVGRCLSDALPEIRDQRFLGLLDGVYRTGITHEGRAELARLPAGPNGALQDAYFNYVYAPLRDSRGNVEGVMVCAFDVTAQEHADRGSEFLARASDLLTSSLDCEQTLAAFARLCVPTIADWAAIDIKQTDGSIRRLVVAHDDPKKIELVQRLTQQVPIRLDDAHGAGRVIRTGKSEVFTRIPQSVLDEAMPGPRVLEEDARALQLLSSICVPIRVAAATIGAISLATAESGRHFLEGDVRFAEELAVRASVAIKNATLYGKAVGEIREQEMRFRLLVESVKDYAIFILDPGGHISTWNAGAERIKGYTAKEIVGRHFSTFYPIEDIEAGKCERELAAATQEGRFEDEGWRIRRDGSRFWANVVITPLRDPQGGLLGFAKVTRDLTQRRAAEENEKTLVREQLARAASDLASRTKDEFVATMSHELRTPLNAMLGWATILSNGPRDEERLKHGLEVIERNARAQERLVSDLLDVSRIISGKLHLTLRRTEVSAVVHAAADVLRPAVDAKGVRVVVDVAPDLGAMVADPDRLQQVMWNLLSNAIRYTPRGGSIRVTGERSDSGIRLCVSDTGSGIPREHLPHIFERFRQVDSSTTRSHGGLGLGLAIVRHLVEAHGGSVEAHSEGAGRGATFTIVLPIRALVPSPEKTETSIASGSVEQMLRNVRVLVVDDDPDSLELLSVALGDAGARVTAFQSAGEALGARGPFDIIISDIGMPEVDGYSFIRRVRSRRLGADTPAIALTAYARAEDGERAMLAGFQEHCAKPVDAGKLLERVKWWARTRREIGQTQ